MHGYSDQWHLSVYLSVKLLKENGSSYQHQTWYTYTPWQNLGMH